MMNTSVWTTDSFFDDQVRDPVNFGLSDNLTNLLTALLSCLTIIFLLDLLFRIIVRSEPHRVSTFSVYRHWLLVRCSNPLEAVCALYQNFFRKKNKIQNPNGSAASLVIPPFDASKHDQSPGASSRYWHSNLDISACNVVFDFHRDESELFDGWPEEGEEDSEAQDHPASFPQWQRLGIWLAGFLVMAVELFLIFAGMNSSTDIAIDRTRIPSFVLRDPGGPLLIEPTWRECIARPLVSKNEFNSHASLFVCTPMTGAEFTSRERARRREPPARVLKSLDTDAAYRKRSPMRAGSTEEGDEDHGIVDSDYEVSSDLFFSDRTPKNAVNYSSSSSTSSCSDENKKATLSSAYEGDDLHIKLRIMGYTTDSRHFTEISLSNGTRFRTLTNISISDVQKVLPSVLSRYGMEICLKKTFRDENVRPGEWTYLMIFDTSNVLSPPWGSLYLPNKKDDGEKEVKKSVKLASLWNKYILSIVRGTLSLEGRTQAFSEKGDSATGPFLQDISTPLITLQRPWLSLTGIICVFATIFTFWAVVAFCLQWGSGIDERVAWKIAFEKIGNPRSFYTPKFEYLGTRVP